jgi:hypothetical protein
VLLSTENIDAEIDRGKDAGAKTYIESEPASERGRESVCATERESESDRERARATERARERASKQVTQRERARAGREQSMNSPQQDVLSTR